MKDKSGRKRNGTGMLLLNKDRAYGVRSETEMRELFLATLGYIFFLSHTSLPLLFSRFLVFAQLRMIVAVFFVHSRKKESHERTKKREVKQRNAWVNNDGRKKEVRGWRREIESS